MVVVGQITDEGWTPTVTGPEPTSGVCGSRTSRLESVPWVAHEGLHTGVVVGVGTKNKTPGTENVRNKWCRKGESNRRDCVLQ